MAAGVCTAGAGVVSHEAALVVVVPLTHITIIANTVIPRNAGSEGDPLALQRSVPYMVGQQASRGLRERDLQTIYDGIPRTGSRRVEFGSSGPGRGCERVAEVDQIVSDDAKPTQRLMPGMPL